MQDIRRSYQTRQQLTSLLSSVQASLAELKVEVASARKLSNDATCVSVIKTSRTASPVGHAPIKACHSPATRNRLSPESGSSHAEGAPSFCHSMSPKILTHADYNPAACQAQDGGMPASPPLRPQCDVHAHGLARRADEPGHLPEQMLMMERDQGGKAHELSQTHALQCDEVSRSSCTVLDPGKLVGSYQQEVRPMENLSHAASDIDKLQRTVNALAEATRHLCQDVVTLRTGLGQLTDLSDNLAIIQGQVQQIQIQIQHQKGPQACEPAQKAAVELQAVHQEINAIHKAMHASPEKSVLSQTVQECCAQIAAMQAELNASSTCIQRVHDLEKNMHQLRDRVKAQHAPVPYDELLNTVRRCESQINVLQLSQSTMQATQHESLAELDRRIIQIERSHANFDVSATAEMFHQRLEVTNSELGSLKAATRQLQESRAGTTQQLKCLSDAVQKYAGHESIAIDVSSLQQDNADLHSKLFQISTSGQEQIRSIEVTMHNMQEAFKENQISMKHANMQLKHVMESQVHSDQDLTSIHCAIDNLNEQLQFKQHRYMRVHSSDSNQVDLQHEDGQVLHPPEQVMGSQGAACVIVSDDTMDIGTTLSADGENREQTCHTSHTLQQTASDVTQGTAGHNDQMIKDLKLQHEVTASQMTGIEESLQDLYRKVLQCQGTVSLQSIPTQVQALQDQVKDAMTTTQDLQNRTCKICETVAHLGSNLSTLQGQYTTTSQTTKQTATDLATVTFKERSDNLSTNQHAPGKSDSDIRMTKLASTLDDLVKCIGTVKRAQVEQTQDIVDLRDELADLKIGLQADRVEMREPDEAVEQLLHDVELQKHQISAVQDTMKIMQDSLMKHSSDSFERRLQNEAENIASVDQRLNDIVDDISSQQQRAENCQRLNDARVAELSATVTNAMAEMLTLRHLLDNLCDVKNEEGTAKLQQEQATQLKQTMQLVNGTDAKLSALNEMLLNNKSETAELREILRASQAAQYQLTDDLLSVRISMEERLDAIEEPAKCAQGFLQDDVMERVNAMAKGFVHLQTTVQNMQSTLNGLPTELQSQGSLQLTQKLEHGERQAYKRIGSVQDSMAVLDVCTKQSGHEALQHVRLNDDATENQFDRVDFVELQNTVARLQHSFGDVQALMQKHSEMTDVVSQLEERANNVDSKLVDLAKMKELVVDKNTLDTVLAEVETAMDDIANELDEIKGGSHTSSNTSRPAADLVKDRLNQHDQQMKKLMHDFETLHSSISDISQNEFQLQLEALGQQVRVVGDDVKALEAGFQNESLCPSSKTFGILSDLVGQLHTQVTALEHGLGSSGLGLAEHVNALEKHKGAVASSSTQPFRIAKNELVSGEPVVMMQFMRPNTHHIVSIETIEDQSPDCSPDPSLNGRQQASSRPVDCDSSLSSIGGDLQARDEKDSMATRTNLGYQDCPQDHGPTVGMASSAYER